MFFLLSFFLATIPFFWLSSGEMDLGGDSSRLYFYDPVNFLKNNSLYSLSPTGINAVEPNHYYLPFVGMIALLKRIGFSSYLLITLFNVVKLVGGFLGVYLIVKELISVWKPGVEERIIELSSILAGIFYIFAPNMIGNWDKALMSHNQIFLNPFMFYFFLRFLLTYRYIYLFSALLISFIFAPNFALTSAPAFFAFYPLAFIFLAFYTTLVRGKFIPWRGLFLGFFLFLGLHAFHLLPQIVSLFDLGSFANTRVFDKESIAHEGIRYFLGVLPLASVSGNILLPSPVEWMKWMAIVIPAIVTLSFILNKNRQKSFLLTGLFFLLTFFLLSAKITDTGVEFYKRLFYLPGFSMFRNFIGQWAFVYTFFYALLFGQALALVLARMGKLTYLIITSVIVGILVFGAWPFLNGELVNKVHWEAKGVRIAIRMDPYYEETLEFLRSLPDEGKILTLPLTDSYYQVLHGTNNGAYVGPSTISLLTGKKDFSGYQILQPFAEDIMRYSREKNYQALIQTLSILNIRYIFHNADPRIYEEKFPGFPYTYLRTSLPATQKDYEELINDLPVKLIYKNGPFLLYELERNIYRPEFYVPKTVYKEKPSLLEDFSYQSAYLERDFLKDGYKTPEVNLKIRKANPSRYLIIVENKTPNLPYLLVFQNAFHRGWKLSVFGEEPMSSEKHIKVNGYANAWFITPDDTGEKSMYTLSLSLQSQKYFWYAVAISTISLMLLVSLFITSILCRVIVSKGEYEKSNR